MGALVTAVILSPVPMPDARHLTPDCVVQVTLAPGLRNHIDMNAARRRAVLDVCTPFWFFLDSDDDLPLDFDDVLESCVAQPCAVAYTDELIKIPGREPVRREAGLYSRSKHIKNLYLLHHLVVCDTARSHAIEPTLPRGVGSFESMLYAQLARESWCYVPRIGYHWHKGDGFHTRPDAVRSMCTAAIWLNRN